MYAGIACGRCGGQVYMETCENQGGVRGHIDVIGSECKHCGLRNELGPCPNCAAHSEHGGTP